MVGFILASILITVILYSWISLIWHRRGYNVKGPFPLPLVGNGLKLIVKRTEFLSVLHTFKEKYNDACLFYLFNKPYVILSHPKYIEPIITDVELITKGRSYKFLEPWLGVGLLTSTGLRWKTHRRFLTSAFHFNILQYYLQVFLKNEKILIKKLEGLTGEKSFNLFPIIALTALDNITETIMGVSIDAQINSESKYVKAIETLTRLIAIRKRNPFYGADSIFKFTEYKKLHDDAIETVHNQANKVIKMRREQLANIKIDEHKNSDLGIKNKFMFLDILLNTKIDGTPLKEEQVREEVDTFMFEGHDTTTSGVCFALYCISKNKDVQERLIEEQKNILGDLRTDPDYNHLNQMKYLECVIKETLRIYPSVPIIERINLKDRVLGGLYIKKNTSLMINIFELQRHPDLFENPLEFNPERFESTATTKNAFQWLAFSAGPRNCIGQKFAMMEMKILIAGIIKRFKLLPSKEEPILIPELILKSENGVTIGLERRE